jgi:hypothetical protein
MNSLPPELIDRISSYLDRDDLKRTLFLSRQFQEAAERYSGAFREFTFKDINHEPQKLLDAFKPKPKKTDSYTEFLKAYRGRRFRYLRYVEVRTSFPRLRHPLADLDDFPCRESREELRQKDEMFTNQIKLVFMTIKAVEDYVTQAHGPGRIEVVILTPLRLVDREFCRHRVSSAWRLHLLRPGNLPELASVRSLSICNPAEYFEGSNYWRFHQGHFYAFSRLDPRVLIDIASRFANLEYLGCQLGVEEGRSTDQYPTLQHFEHDFEACARDARRDLAKALQSTVLPATLRYVQLDFLIQLDQEERGGGPNLLIGSARHDMLSTSLRVFTANLRRLDIRLIADETLFWSSDMSWPNLEFLSVMFSPTTPSGSWYFRGASGEGENDVGYEVTDNMYPPLETGNAQDMPWHNADAHHSSNDYVSKFRSVPNDETIRPFLAAFAEAASTRMHALKAASLWTNTLEGLAWGIAYAIPGQLATLYERPGQDNLPDRQLWWKVGSWRPDSFLHKLFQDIGRAEHGEELIEHWGDALLGREDFEESLAAFPRYSGTYPRLSLMKDWYLRRTG